MTYREKEKGVSGYLKHLFHMIVSRFQNVTSNKQAKL
jgi:hypothetical protein